MKRPEKRYRQGETFVDVAPPEDDEGVATLVIYTPDQISSIPVGQPRLGQLMCELNLWLRVAARKEEKTG